MSKMDLEKIKRGVGLILEGIGEVVRRQPSADYVALLTGQDYPIKPNAYISAFFLLAGTGSGLVIRTCRCGQGNHCQAV